MTAKAKPHPRPHTRYMVEDWTWLRNEDDMFSLDYHSCTILCFDTGNMPTPPVCLVLLAAVAAAIWFAMLSSRSAHCQLMMPQMSSPCLLTFETIRVLFYLLRLLAIRCFGTHSCL